MKHKVRCNSCNSENLEAKYNYKGQGLVFLCMSCENEMIIIEGDNNIFMELDMLVGDESEKHIILETIKLYDVTLEIVKEMILSGLEGEQINKMCSLWYENNIPIRVGWKSARTVLGIIIK